MSKINEIDFLNKVKFLTKNYINLSKKCIERFKKGDKKQTDEIIDYTLKRHMLVNDADRDKVKLLKEIFFMIIEEIAQNENEEISNLKFVDYGYSSDVYSLGEKIIKIGDKRLTPRFPNNPYIIKPY